MEPKSLHWPCDSQPWSRLLKVAQRSMVPLTMTGILQNLVVKFCHSIRPDRQRPDTPTWLISQTYILVISIDKKKKRRAKLHEWLQAMTTTSIIFYCVLHKILPVTYQGHWSVWTAIPEMENFVLPFLPSTSAPKPQLLYLPSRPFCLMISLHQQTTDFFLLLMNCLGTNFPPLYWDFLQLSIKLSGSLAWSSERCCLSSWYLLWFLHTQNKLSTPLYIVKLSNNSIIKSIHLEVSPSRGFPWIMYPSCCLGWLFRFSSAFCDCRDKCRKVPVAKVMCIDLHMWCHVCWRCFTFFFLVWHIVSMSRWLLQELKITSESSELNLVTFSCPSYRSLSLNTVGISDSPLLTVGNSMVTHTSAGMQGRLKTWWGTRLAAWQWPDIHQWFPRPSTFSREW